MGGWGLVLGLTTIYEESILLYLFSLTESKSKMVILCLIYFFVFNSVFLDEFDIEPFPRPSPSFLVKDILKNMASTLKFEKQRQERIDSERLRRSSCYQSLCQPETKPRQNNDTIKRLWYSYAF